MKWTSRTRCATTCIVFTLLFSVFSFRLVYLQLIKHDEYADLAAEKHGFKQTINAELLAVQGQPADIGGYYRPDEAKATAVMTPSTTLNATLADLAQ